MKYHVLVGVCLSGGKDVYPGDEVDLDPGQARQFVQQGRLVEVPEADAPAPKAEPVTTTQIPSGETPVVLTQDPPTRKRG